MDPQLVHNMIKLRNLIMNAIANHIYDSYLPLYLVTDGSDLAIGSMLYQAKDTKIFRLGFFSKALNGPQRNYATIHIELLALE